MKNVERNVEERGLERKGKAEGGKKKRPDHVTFGSSHFRAGQIERFVEKGNHRERLSQGEAVKKPSHLRGHPCKLIGGEIRGKKGTSGKASEENHRGKR